MKRSYKNILNQAACQSIPDGINLYPRIAAQLERKTLMQTLHARPVISIIILIFALSLLTGVVYAVGRSLGYIPGVGIVEQDTPIRVLVQPSTAEQDGITLTVTDAVLSGDKTILLYTLENIPWENLSHQEDLPGCFELPFLRLPDGSTLASGQGEGYFNQMRLEYPPIPSGVNEAAFILPCIMNSVPGLAPENWELPLQFGPASPDLTIIQVIEIPPTAAPEIVQGEEAPVELNNALLIGDQYILTGIINQPDSGGRLELVDFQVTDASGVQVYTQMPALTDLPSFDWGFQFQVGTVQLPITLTFECKQIKPVAGSTAVFDFDAGENPQQGQEWVVNRPIRIGGRTITLETVRTDSRGGYNFSFSGDPDVSGLSLQISGSTALGGGGGGDGQGNFSVSQSFPELPVGKLRVILTDLLVASLPQTWSMQWSDENPPSTEASEPAAPPEACLTLARWTQLAGQNDLQAPPVGGSIITTVNEGGLHPAIYISHPDGTDYRRSAVGGWPSLSNGGDRLAYSAGDGLHVLDLSTGMNTAFGYDGYRIIWSPDDSRLLFTTTFNLYQVNADGSNLEKINTDPSQVLAPVGWLPDGQGVVYSLLTGAGFELQRYDWQSGQTEPLFTIHNKAGYGALSPDGQWLVFADRESEAANWGIFVARLDGSERRLIAEPEVPTSFTSVWGPDGSWLIINTRDSDGTLIPVLVNPFTCQAAVLPLTGAVEGWSQ